MLSQRNTLETSNQSNIQNIYIQLYKANKTKKHVGSCQMTQTMPAKHNKIKSKMLNV